MGTICKTIAIEVDPAEAWDAIRDFGALHTRLVPGFVTDTRIEGDERVVTFANGVVQREPLVTLDDDARRLVYSAVDSPMGATHYNASVEVLADGPTDSRVIWRVDFLPNELAAGLDAAMERGAQAMKESLARAGN